MFKRLVSLWASALLLSMLPVHAAPLPAGRETPPPSMDRNLPPDQYPTNVVKVLRTTNKAQTNSYVPLVFTFRNVNPFNVIRFLRRPVQLEEGDLFTFASPEGNGGRVLFIVPSYMEESLAELVRQLDQPNQTTAEGTKRIYRRLKHRRASVTDPDFLASIASFSTKDGSLFLTDPETNALYWEDAPSGAQALDDALTDWYDVPTAMVQLVVKVYELDAYNNGAIGLDYTAWKNTLGHNLFAVGAFSESGHINDTGPFTPQLSGQNQNLLPRRSFSASGYNYAYNYQVSSEFFDFLVTKGKAKILTKTKLAALNTHRASLTAGDQILYYAVNTSTADGLRDTGQPFQQNDTRVLVPKVLKNPTPQTSSNTSIPQLSSSSSELNFPQETSRLSAAQTGIDLRILPIIGEQSIKLDLTLFWNDFNGYDSNGFPVLNDRHLQTILRTGLGDEIVIGGINRQVRSSGTRKVPILGSIPILGYAFGGETEQNKNTEIVVAIEPVAIDQYDIATDYRMTPGEKKTVERAEGKIPIKAPQTTWGFDQLILDPSRSKHFHDAEGNVVK